MGWFSNLASYPSRLTDMFLACSKIFLLNDPKYPMLGMVAAGALATAAQSQRRDMMQQVELLEKEFMENKEKYGGTELEERFTEFSLMCSHAMDVGNLKFRRELDRFLENLIRKANIEDLLSILDEGDKKEVYFNHMDNFQKYLK